ncbi:MAG: glycosyltransferase [Rhodothermales bacterium]|nr:glycosyltransferase [Rhodothermales bacterium]MBO6780545.1 glycosyltransferase [Rhodothermales bacterium]
MRLLVVVNVFDPDLGGGVLFADFCRGLSTRGFEVEVMCAVPYYPEWTDKRGQNGLAIHREHGHRSVRVLRHGLFIPRDPGSMVQRLIYEGSFFASLVRTLPAPGSYDLVMAYCPLVGGVGYGALAARLAGCPLWLNVQDLSAEAAAAAGIVRSSRAAEWFRGIQRFLFNRADVWSTISPVMQTTLAPLARRGQTVHMLPNWLHGSLAETLAHAPSQAHLNGGPVRLLYSGNIGGKQDLIRFCKALARTSARFEFDIRGGGADAEVVERWVQDTGDARFRFGPLTDEAELAAGLAGTHLFVVTEKEGAGGSFIPSKLLPAYGSGTAILSVSDAGSPLGREMAQSGAGPRLGWSEVSTLGSLISGLEPGVLNGWRQASRARSRAFDREEIIDRYAALMREAVDRHRV